MQIQVPLLVGKKQQFFEEIPTTTIILELGKIFWIVMRKMNQIRGEGGWKDNKINNKGEEGVGLIWFFYWLYFLWLLGLLRFFWFSSIITAKCSENFAEIAKKKIFF